MEKVSVSHLKKILDYNPETGIFTWLIRPRRRACSPVAGTISLGYRRICIKQHHYSAHQLAWLYVTGQWAGGEIDHINGVKDDNRWVNLRKADRQTNQANSKIRVSNKTGFKGAGSPLAGRRKFPARITVNYKTLWLGSFDTAQEAHDAYLAAAREHFGEFARAL